MLPLQAQDGIFQSVQKVPANAIYSSLLVEAGGCHTRPLDSSCSGHKFLQWCQSILVYLGQWMQECPEKRNSRELANLKTFGQAQISSSVSFWPVWMLLQCVNCSNTLVRGPAGCLQPNLWPVLCLLVNQRRLIFEVQLDEPKHARPTPDLEVKFLQRTRPERFSQEDSGRRNLWSLCGTMSWFLWGTLERGGEF